MKTKFISPLKTTFIQQSKYALAALATVALAISSPVLAQDYVTGTPTLSNVDPSSVIPYSAWASSPPTVFTSTASGLEVSSLGYGSLYYAVPVDDQVTLNPNDAEAVLTLTVNNVADAEANVWLGVPFILNDNVGAYTLGGYAGEFGYADQNNGLGSASWDPTGDILTETVGLNGTLLSTIQAGGDTITGFNLELDPAVYPGGLYDVTFDSLELQPVPEPASVALVGMGLAGLMALRRRK